MLSNPQPIEYPDSAALEQALGGLRGQLPLVEFSQIDRLQKLLAQAQQGNALLLQGGDCAESFADCNPDVVQGQVGLLQQCADILQSAFGQPVIRVARIAGQYAKPRTQLNETRGDITLPSYRGDLINDVVFEKHARTPDPSRLLRAYACAKQSLSTLQQLSPQTYVSHEALHLPYENALTHTLADGRHYNLSTHFPWIGVRTNAPNDAHIEYAASIANPIAVKIGPAMTPENLVALCEKLNPKRIPGRLTLIHRMGVELIESRLNTLIHTLQQVRHPVLWVCDPMHGNTRITQAGFKTRYYSNIARELELAIETHIACDSHLGGLHVEMNFEAITECVGSQFGIHESDLHRTYKTLLDPRLNREQALALASHFCEQVAAVAL